MYPYQLNPLDMSNLLDMKFFPNNLFRVLDPESTHYDKS